MRKKEDIIHTELGTRVFSQKNYLHKNFDTLGNFKK